MKFIDILNEDAEVIPSEGLTDENIKRVKIIYKLFKKGMFEYDQISRYGYKLPDDYYIYKDELGDLCIKLTGKEGQDVFMYGKLTHHELPIQPHHNGLRGWIKERIVKKFKEFNINFIF